MASMSPDGSQNGAKLAILGAKLVILGARLAILALKRAPIFAPVGSKKPQNVCADAVQKKHKTSKNLTFFKVFGVPFFSKFFGERVLCMLARYWRSSAASCRQDVVSCY